jgi:phenylalanyl-tRNA synthetase beta chain
VRVPISWLREFVALPAGDDAIADRLAMLGFPVGAIERRPPLSGVVVGRIVALEPHPNADRLQVARVDAGREQSLTIATAATNVAAGQTIAVATVGARLPEMVIAARTMRGVPSEGMMISAQELGLPAEWFEDGIMQMDESLAPGSDVVEAFGLDTAILEVEITANRPDAMSVLGLARELAASYALPLRVPSLENPGRDRDPAGAAPQVTIESDDCRRFIAQRFDGVRVGTAPAWMRVRLALAGQRPINNLVDVSNYVMLETGQPLHFYDAAAIPDSHLIVRSARDGERLVTLDGVQRTLDSRALVIAGKAGVLGLAGVMGGAGSEVTAQTSAIVLESANFRGLRVRRTANSLGLRTEASARHEKSLAPALTDAGAARAAQLLCDFGATAYRPHIAGDELAAPAPIHLEPSEVERVLGLAIPRDRIEGHLIALGCRVATVGDALAVTPPAWRGDLDIPEDLIEEVARIEGYDAIPAVMPSVAPHEISSQAYALENRIARALAALGYREILTHSLQGSSFADGARRAGIDFGLNPIEVQNPLSEEQRYLRFSLLPGMVEYLAARDAPARVFELGEVFCADGDSIVESGAAAFAFSVDAGDEPPWRDSAFARLKGDCETLLREITGRAVEVFPAAPPGLHPGKSARLEIDGRNVGVIGALDPRLAQAGNLRRDAYFCLLETGALPPHRTPHYSPPSKFPSTYRDVALVAGVDLAARDLERAIAGALGPVCTRVRVFDEFRGTQLGEGRKSLAVRVTLQRFDTTITDREADAAIAKLLDVVGERFGATLRT